QRGDLWHLGGHRVLCGDATAADDVARVLEGPTAACVTSPPYAAQRAYGGAVPRDWEALMAGAFAHVDPGAQVLVVPGLAHEAGAWVPYWDPWLAWMRAHGWRTFGWYVWDQGPGLPGDWGGRLAPAHEFVFHLNQAPRAAAKIRRCALAGRRTHKPGRRSGLRGQDGTVSTYTHEGRAVQAQKVPDSVLRITRHKGAVPAGKHPGVHP